MKTNSLSLRRSVSTIFLTITLVFCFAFTSLATTYYISPTGNDITGNGTIGNPWRTMFKATSSVTGAGNIIHINAGNYTETQQSNLAVGVSIEGAGNTTTIIKSDITGQWTTLLSLSSAQGTNGNQSISGVTFDGQYVSEAVNKTWIGIWITGRSNVTVHDCKVINFRDRGVIFAGNSASNPLQDPNQYATGNKFYNNTVLNSAAGTGGYGAGLINIGSQNGLEIYNNTLIQDQRVAFKNGWPIKYWENGYLKGCKIYNNILKKAYYQGTYPGENGDWDFAIELFNLQGLEIYNNSIQGCIDLNYNYKGSYAFSAWIHHNTLDHATINSTRFESGIILEFATQSIIIEDNIINNSSSGVQFNTRSPGNSGGYTYPPPPGGYSELTNNIIRNNLFSNIYTPTVGSSGVGIIIASDGSDDPYINNLYIYNNTIVAKAGSAPWFGIDFSSQPNGNVNNVYIRNNIVNGFQGAWIMGTSGAGNTNITGMTLTHNNAYNNGSNVPSWPGGNPANYTYNNNLSTNPLFVSSIDFHLQPVSPLIDIGVYVGEPFNGNGPDRGYVEFGAVTLPIDLVEFNVRENAGKNLLQWTTATETNSSHFNIERSTNAQSYETIGRVNAVGYSTSEVKYNFTDAYPLKGMNYYRLAMTDKDGKFEYSKIVSISSKENHSVAITYIDLSSAINTISLGVTSTKNQAANLSIIDISGRTVLNSGIQIQKGNNTITKTIQALSKGVYYVKLLTADEVVVKNTLSRN